MKIALTAIVVISLGLFAGHADAREPARSEDPPITNPNLACTADGTHCRCGPYGIPVAQPSDCPSVNMRWPRGQHCHRRAA